MTIQQFAYTFRPVCGTHKVWLIHPFTGCPVEVCFTLPPGCPRVKLFRRQVEFDYGRYEVEIRFYRNGRYVVDIDD